jgi:outer membrane lipoprotein-sorting protein
MKTVVKQAMVALLAGSLLICLRIIPVSAQGDAPKRAEGRKILEQMITAMGGRGRISAITDSVISSELKVIRTAVTARRIVYRKRPGKMRIETRVNGMTIVMAFNGNTGWMITPRTTSVLEMPAPLLEEIERKSIEREALLNPDEFGLTVSYEGRKAIGGKDYIMINQTYRCGYVSTMYLDPNTYLPYKAVGMGLTDTLEKAEMEAVFSDYRKTQGIRVPFSIRIIQNDKESANMSILEYKYNTNLEDSLFEKP